MTPLITIPDHKNQMNQNEHEHSKRARARAARGPDHLCKTGSFSTIEYPYNLRLNSQFFKILARSVYHGTESLSYLGPKTTFNIEKTTIFIFFFSIGMET